MSCIAPSSQLLFEEVDQYWPKLNVTHNLNYIEFPISSKFLMTHEVSEQCDIQIIFTSVISTMQYNM